MRGGLREGPTQARQVSLPGRPRNCKRGVFSQGQCVHSGLALHCLDALSFRPPKDEALGASPSPSAPAAVPGTRHGLLRPLPCRWWKHRSSTCASNTFCSMPRGLGTELRSQCCHEALSADRTSRVCQTGGRGLGGTWARSGGYQGCAPKGHWVQQWPCRSGLLPTPDPGDGPEAPQLHPPQMMGRCLWGGLKGEAE